jgi:GWxTD domain-containing protein
VRRLFEDVRPIVAPPEMRALERLDGKRREVAVAAFWRDLDPDPTTRMNEARLEFWSRAAHAYFLYYDPRQRQWDVRGQLYLRFGPPRWRDFNPPRGPSAESNFQVWGYPDLGMRIWLQDQARNGRYQMPGKPLAFHATDRPIPMLPYPDSLARHPELFGTGRGVATFHRHPPGAVPIDVRATLSRFSGSGGAHLLAQAEVPGSPADDLTAEWVVLDSTGSEIARSSQVLTVSACDPTELRVSDFATDLPPGSYGVGLAVRGARGALGLFRTQARLTAAEPGLGISDIVVTCGQPPRPGRGEEPVIRLAPNPKGRIRRGGTLNAYFEIYGLAAPGGRNSRFEYTATLRSAGKDARAWLQRLFSPRPQVPEITARREEESAGGLRRQFLSVPVQSLPCGRYQLEISVKDLIAGVEESRSASFVID